METIRVAQRRRLITAALLACATLPAASARALEPANGPVVLTIAGAVAHTNDGAVASFDMALLRSLRQTSFSTRTPWYPQPRKFTGVLVGDLLEAVGAKGTVARAAALNDYRVEMPVDELVMNGALVAYLLDDQPMLVRDKGPLVIIFPFSDRPELRNAMHYSRAVWQLRSLELR